MAPSRVLVCAKHLVVFRIFSMLRFSLSSPRWLWGWSTLGRELPEAVSVPTYSRRSPGYRCPAQISGGGRLVRAPRPGQPGPCISCCASRSVRLCDCSRNARYLSISKGELGTWSVLELLLSDGSPFLRVHKAPGRLNLSSLRGSLCSQSQYSVIHFPRPVGGEGEREGRKEKERREGGGRKKGGGEGGGGRGGGGEEEEEC